LYNIALYIALIAGALPLVSLIAKRRSVDLQMAPLFFIWATGIASLYEWIGSVILNVNSSIWFQVYCTMELLAIPHCFKLLLSGRFTSYFNTAWIILLLVYLMSLVVLYHYPDMSLVANTMNKIGLTLFVIIGTLLWFYKLFADSSLPDLWRHADFYFVAGFFIYYCSTFFLFLLAYLINDTVDFKSFWIVNVLATIFFRLLMTVGVWQMKRA